MTDRKKDIWLDDSFTPGEPLSSDDVTSPEEMLDEEKAMAGLRPGSFADYVGQSVIKDNLKIACSAAANRNEPLDHLLIHGPPGLGKTSLARVIANELGVNFKSTSGPIIEKPGDLAAILTGLGPRDVIFIDEIHRLPRIVEEVLYPAMEDYELDILIGQGPAAKSIKVDLKPFTLVGATTRAGLLTSPLRDRFGLSYRVEFYEPEELKAIVKRSAQILKTAISDEAALEIGSRSRGTPRIANRLLKRVRDYAQELGSGEIDLDSVKNALKRLNIDDQGLDHMDRQILKTIIEKFQGGPVGIETIAVSLGEDKRTVEDVYEPFLIQKGFLVRTRRGREVTDLAYEHLNLSSQISQQGKLKF